MNDTDFHDLRVIASRIKDEAISMKCPDVAVSDFGKAVGVLFEEIYEGNNVVLPINPIVFARALRTLADRISDKY